MSFKNTDGTSMEFHNEAIKFSQKFGLFFNFVTPTL